MNNKDHLFAGTHFDSKLAKCRIDAKLTLSQVEQLTGLDYRILQRWEAGGTQTPRSKMYGKIANLAELYGVTVADIENMIASAYSFAKKDKYVICDGAYVPKPRKAKTKESSTNKATEIKSTKTNISKTEPNKSTTDNKATKDNKKKSKAPTISRVELLELAYGEVPFNEFMDMVKIFYKDVLYEDRKS